MSSGPVTALSFKSLSLTRGDYGSDKGKLKAKISVGFFDHGLEVILPEDMAVEIMRMCAPALAAEVNRTLNDVARDAEQLLLGSDVGDAIDAKADAEGLNT